MNRRFFFAVLLTAVFFVPFFPPGTGPGGRGLHRG